MVDAEKKKLYVWCSKKTNNQQIGGFASCEHKQTFWMGEGRRGCGITVAGKNGAWWRVRTISASSTGVPTTVVRP